jgi:frataxin-like iron-binding protein CyaY
VLSRERRAAWLTAFEHSLEQTSDGMDLRVDVQGDEAVVHLSGGGQILLKREAGRWHVWDVQASTQP